MRSFLNHMDNAVAIYKMVYFCRMHNDPFLIIKETSRSGFKAVKPLNRKMAANEGRERLRLHSPRIWLWLIKYHFNK